MMMRFKLGDEVTWVSTSNASTTMKMGRVVSVIPAGRDPREFVTQARRQHEAGSKFGYGRRRNHESYLVLVRDGKKKAHIYWPRVSQLEPA